MSTNIRALFILYNNFAGILGFSKKSFQSCSGLGGVIRF